MLVERSIDMNGQAYYAAFTKSDHGFDMTAALCMRALCLPPHALPKMLQALLLTSIVQGKLLIDL